MTDPFHPHIGVLLDFLFSEFNRAPGRGYGTMNTIRSAISAIATIAGQPAGQHALVSRFMKAVFLQRPAFSRTHVTWDPQMVLDYICSLGSTEALSLLHLSRKLVILMLLLSGQRGQTLHLLDVRNLSLSESQAIFGIGDLLKTSRPGAHFSGLVFEAYPHDSRLCIVHTIKHYLYRTRSIRGELTGLFLTTRSPVWLASRDTLRRWVRDVMRAAGIDLTVFSPHSTRSASSSKAALVLPLSTVVSTIGWARESTFTRHYHKPLAPHGQFARAVLP